MELVREVDRLRRLCDEARAAGRRVGLVPTMGALHAGHVSLVEEAARRSDYVVVSVFVNPTQFGPGEDLDRYPRTLDADCRASEAAGATLVFAPDAAAMYVPGEETRVNVGATARHLCGAHRPGHFEGVCTIVTKLFGIVGPSVAVFGRKDYQQWRVIQRFTEDLFLPVEIVGAPLWREPDGLALSSRNRYLSPADRQRALGLARGLSHACRAFDEGERNAGRLRAAVRRHLEPATDSIDYVEVAHPDTVIPFADDERAPDRALLAVAARVGATRLIDNVVLGEDRPPIAEGA